VGNKKGRGHISMANSITLIHSNSTPEHISEEKDISLIKSSGGAPQFEQLLSTSSS
jgi:hypothetical protein